MSEKRLYDSAPIRLKIETGGWGMRESTLKLSNGKLLYETTDATFIRTHSETITPSNQQWIDFRAALDDIGIWKWQYEYNSYICDGSCWEVKISYADKKLVSVGFNNYPSADGTPSRSSESTRTFRRLIRAVRELIGKRKF